MKDFTKRWKQVLKLEEACLFENTRLTRKFVMDELDVSEFDAKFLLLCLENRKPIANSGDVSEEVKLKARLRDSNAKVRDQQKQIEKLTRQVELRSSLSRQRLEVPKSFSPSTRKGVAIPTAVLNDTHFDEFVDPAGISYVNGYNREIATKRLDKYFKSVVRLGRDYYGGFRMEGLVQALAGDMVSGVIHEELAASNCYPITETLLYYSALIVSGLEMELEQFKTIFVPGVVGNHGRLKPKVTFKGAVQDNWDFLLYEMVADKFRNNKHVTFYIPTSPDAYYPVYDTRYCLTHGNQFRGGNGWAGPLMPVMKGDSKKKERQNKLKRPYDVLVCGHFHSQRWLSRAIMSGSLIGYNEYASANNLEFEVPRQAFWLTDPEHGVTMTAPIHCQCENEGWEQVEAEAVGFGG